MPCSSVPADHQDVVAGHPHVPAEDVGGHAETGDVADVARAVGVRPGDGGQDVGHAVKPSERRPAGSVRSGPRPAPTGPRPGSAPEDVADRREGRVTGRPWRGRSSSPTGSPPSPRRARPGSVRVMPRSASRVSEVAAPRGAARRASRPVVTPGPRRRRPAAPRGGTPRPGRAGRRPPTNGRRPNVAPSGWNTSSSDSPVPLEHRRGGGRRQQRCHEPVDAGPPPRATASRRGVATGGTARPR